MLYFPLYSSLLSVCTHVCCITLLIGSVARPPQQHRSSKSWPILAMGRRHGAERTHVMAWCCGAWECAVQCCAWWYCAAMCVCAHVCVFMCVWRACMCPSCRFEVNFSSDLWSIIQAISWGLCQVRISRLLLPCVRWRCRSQLTVQNARTELAWKLKSKAEAGLPESSGRWACAVFCAWFWFGVWCLVVC